jgi:predicted lipid-binding transport protein (Tim44 family)
VLVVTDENVPTAVGGVFRERGHEVRTVAEALNPTTPDELIADYADRYAAIVITWNRRDFKRLSSVVSPDNVRRFRNLSWIAFRCNEARGAERARRWIEAIELHLTLASARRDSRLMIDITERTFTVLG